MCTGIAFQTRDFYFGRNLDYDFSYGEELVIVPRTHPFSFRNGRHLKEHHALMGMVIERILSTKSGLNEAFTSLLRGFEVCDVMFSIFA